MLWGALQWLESLDKQKREEKLEETMHLMAEGIIKTPPPSAPPAASAAAVGLFTTMRDEQYSW